MADCKNEQMGIVQIADKQGTDERINMSITDVMYWLDKMQEKDRLIYTKEEIERLNRQIYCRCLETGDMFDIKEIVKEYSPAVWPGICISRADVKRSWVHGRKVRVIGQKKMGTIKLRCYCPMSR